MSEFDHIEGAFAHFGPRMRAFLEAIAYAANMGEGQVYELDEEYGYEASWPTLGVQFFLVDAYDYGDAEEDEQGRLVNPMLEAIMEGGQILISFAPYNYSPQVWVDLREETGPDELERRVAIIESFREDVANTVVTALRDGYEAAIGKGAS